MRIGLVLLLATLLVAGCSWFREKEVPLEGKRITVMTHAQTLVPEAQSQPVVLPPALRNADWPQAGGAPSHNMQHLAGGAPVGEGALRIDAGGGASSSSPLMAPPIVAAGRLYTMDTDHKVHAFDTGSGNKLWSTDLAKDTDDDDTLIGGLAYDQGRLFAATGFGDLIAMDAGNGQEVWRQAVGSPMHGPPSVDSGRVYVITIDNVLQARSTLNGNEVWPPRRAIAEPASLLGTSSPTVGGGLVIAPFSSGEIMALRADNGRVVWTDTLGSARRTDELALLADIRARPVLDGQTVYAFSYSGVLAAIDVRNGQHRWEREIGGINAPWLAGQFLFVVDNNNQLICLNAETGGVVWLVQLPVFENEKDLEDPIIWVGPVLSGDRLIVLGSHGEAQTISPYTGALLVRSKLKKGVSVEPAIAEGTLFILDDDGRVTAFR